MKSALSLILIFVILFFSSFSQTLDSEGYYLQGIDDLESKKYIQAIANFTNALSEKPDYGAAYFQRAVAKQELAIMAGYESIELCSDLAQALDLGEEKAIPYIQKYCQNECYKIETAFFQPEMVFCADFSSKVLYDLPDEAYIKLTNVSKINLFNNKFTEIPQRFKNLNLLLFLDISSNRLTELQPVIGTLIYLEELKLNKNQITILPVEIGNLKALKNLHLKGNRISKLPKEMSKLESIEYMDLSANALKKMPDDLSNYKNLKTLLLMGNNFGKKEQKRINEALPNCTVYF